ncbi:50S ribosomal protein L22 [Candidatus Fokinia solitaria]|uniref:Large ribosomal subunit protein uL22 n=1 Tax=Candidatus Fokinia solitaria TaxID=1802984 RepID=A0A2U8BSX0_9RICK|nr:50S ribosomal protein L22 [Candidatus Fokinia solitaria]AWD33405.1 50S ribosomal protein L22 [Candidatus Fokinia solitaria]
MQNKIAVAKSAPIKTSAFKASLVLSLVRGLDVHAALLQLQFSRKKIAYDVHKLVRSAIANAEHNCNMDVDRLYISKILVNHAFYLKRFMPRAKGRANRIMKPFSRICLELSERQI